MKNFDIFYFFGAEIWKNMYSTENPVKYINVGVDVVKYKGMLLCVMESNERDMFELVPIICGYRRLLWPKDFCTFLERSAWWGCCSVKSNDTVIYISISRCTTMLKSACAPALSEQSFHWAFDR